MLIKEASIQDIDELYHLNELFNGEGCTTKEMMYEVLVQPRTEKIIIGCIDDKVVGFCCIQIVSSICYKNRVAEVTELFVKEEYRRQGIALAMMKYVEEVCRDNGVLSVHLLTGMDNYDAQALYECIGYQKKSELMYKKYIGK